MTTKKAAVKTVTKVEVKEGPFSKLNVENIEKVAKEIWLAGLGAYGRSFDEVKTLSDKINGDSKKALEDGQKFFDELVARGEKLQTTTEEKFKEGKSDLEERIESRIKKLKSLVPTSSKLEIKEQLNTVNRKLDTLNKEIKKSA